jgi:hypothetical protein
MTNIEYFLLKAFLILKINRLYFINNSSLKKDLIHIEEDSKYDLNLGAYI